MLESGPSTPSTTLFPSVNRLATLPPGIQIEVKVPFGTHPSSAEVPRLPEQREERLTIQAAPSIGCLVGRLKRSLTYEMGVFWARWQ
jgi:hypothetical protein